MDSGRSQSTNELLNGLYDNLEDLEQENPITLDLNKLSISKGLTPTPSATNSAVSSALSTPAKREKLTKFGLAWVNLTFSPNLFMSKNTKTILRNISGQIKFGTIVGLMGPSGCGKSTLLRCINGRIESGLSDETEIYVSKERPIESCFIVQDQKEHLLMGLTTRESLLYASKIKNQDISELYDDEPFAERLERSRITGARLSKKIDKFEHKEFVDKLMTDLALTDCADTLILNCSGGQQKRIVIALELVGYSKPNIMCIDEPTSGLDSNAAEQVIDCLREVSRKHSIGIVTTIHQPNSDVLMMFDSLYVLSLGGYCVYNGKPENLKNFLLNSKISITETQVPIEVLLKVCSKATYNSELENGDKFEVDEQIIELSVNTSLGSTAIKRECERYGKLTDVKHINSSSLGFSFPDLWYLTLRTTNCYVIRGWKSVLFITLFELISGISCALLFGEVGLSDGCLTFNPNIPQNISCIFVNPIDEMNKEQQTEQNFKFLFFLLVMHNFLQMCYTVLTFPLEVKIFFNEQQNRWYSSGSYYWAKNSVDLMIGITITYLFCWITYYMTSQIGLNHWYNGLIDIDQRFGIYLIASFLCCINTQGLAYIWSISASHNLKVALCLAIGGNLSVVLFSGFFIPVADMNDILQFISYGSYVKMAFETQVLAVYGLDRCDEKQQKWSAILYRMKIKENIDWHIRVLVFLAIVWRIIALIILIIKTNDLKPSFKSIKRNNAIKAKSSHFDNNRISSAV